MKMICVLNAGVCVNIFRYFFLNVAKNKTEKIFELFFEKKCRGCNFFVFLPCYFFVDYTKKE